MNKELKPCPFCGGKAEFLTHKEFNTTYYGVCCENTGCCSMSTFYLLKEQAIKAWNTRKPIDKVVEQLEEARNVKFIYDEVGHICGSDFETKIEINKAIKIVKDGAE